MLGEYMLIGLSNGYLYIVFLNRREPDNNFCSYPNFTVYCDAPVMAGNDAIRDRQPKTCSTSHGLCGEEGVENGGYDVFRDAAASVSYF
mgnify:CR=1 FL=1